LLRNKSLAAPKGWYGFSSALGSPPGRIRTGGAVAI
jgi:hypothetical protein